MMSIPNMPSHLCHCLARVTCARGHILVDRVKHRAYVTLMQNNDDLLDATGLLCPLPVLKARKRLQGLAHGAKLTMIADDPAAVIDVPHFCQEAGHTLLSSHMDGARQTYVIQKG